MHCPVGCSQQASTGARTRPTASIRAAITQITCETSPSEFPASLNVAVLVDGTATATFCCFAYSREYTPSKLTGSLNTVYPPLAACHRPRESR